MVTATEYERWKNRVEDLKVKAERARGALEEATNRLKEMGYDCVEEAEQAVAKMEAELQSLEDDAERAMADFKAKWEDKLT